MLEVDVVQQPRFWAKFSRLTLTASGPSGFGGSALSHCVCFSGLAFCFFVVHFAPQGVVYFCSLRSRVNVCVPSIVLVDI